MASIIGPRSAFALIRNIRRLSVAVLVVAGLLAGCGKEHAPTMLNNKRIDLTVP